MELAGRKKKTKEFDEQTVIAKYSRKLRTAYRRQDDGTVQDEVSDSVTAIRHQSHL
jgi:hypothetical protein